MPKYFWIANTAPSLAMASRRPSSMPTSHRPAWAVRTRDAVASSSGRCAGPDVVTRGSSHRGGCQGPGGMEDPLADSAGVGFPGGAGADFEEGGVETVQRLGEFPQHCDTLLE